MQIEKYFHLTIDALKMHIYLCFITSDAVIGRGFISDMTFPAQRLEKT